MYRISQVAAMTGVPVATLRAWERRYRVIVPTRSDGNYRLYDADSVQVIMAMRRLLEQGWSAQQAAEHLIERRGPVDPSGPPARDTALDLAAGAAGAAGAAVPVYSPHDFTTRLLDAAAAMDVLAVSSCLDGLFGTVSFEPAVDDLLLPALEVLGRAWTEGRFGVAAEHLVTHAAMRRIGAAFEAAGPSVTGPRIVTGLPAGCHHEVGMLAFATAARRQGLNVLHLGSDLPAPQWVEAVSEFDAGAAVVAAPARDDVPPATEVVHALAATRPAMIIGAGGRHQHALPRPAHPLGHRIGDAARALAEHVHRQGIGAPA